jgi:predicted aldo/keto reductase-like oxidoreductase
VAYPIPRPGLPRRDFLKTTGLGALAALGARGARAGEVQSARVRRYVTLGRTGLRVPDIGFGASRLSGNEGLVRHALERGITHFDTAEGYTRGASETTLGNALRGQRERVTVVSKTHCHASTSAGELMGALEASLRRLQSDRIEIYLNHAVNDVRRLQNPAWPEFVEKAKSQGKIRFAGMSGHGGRLVECLDYAVDNRLADVFLVGYNFGQDPAFYEHFVRNFDFVAVQPGLPRVLLKARKAGIGVFAMKTLRGARLNDMRPYEASGGSFAQAALRWVLAGPYADAVVITMRSPGDVDEYLGASGYGAPGEAGMQLLARYEAEQGATQCRYGCDVCSGSCPKGVAIPEVLRTRMYSEDYGDPDLGRTDYARLGDAGAAACLQCSGAPCATACPFGIPIGSLTRRTHAGMRA